MPVVGLLGAFSIENAGDALIGLATRRGLERARPDLELRLYAPRLPQPLWRHEFSARRGLGAPVSEAAGAFADGLDALVVGGGGLLVPDPSFAAFWTAEARAWNALGAHGPWRRPEAAPLRDGLRRACERLAYASVRDGETRKLLRECGFAGPVEQVPDPVLGLELPDDGTGERLLREAGIPPGSFVVGLSPGRALADARAAGFFAELLAALRELDDVEVLVFPFGRIYGDEEMADLAAAALPRARRLRRPLDPIELWHLIGRLDLYACTRLHAAIAALAQDRAFLVLDEYRRPGDATSKIRELLRDAGLEERCLWPFHPEEPARRLREAVARRQESAAPVMAALRARLARHFAELAAVLSPPRG